MNFHDRPAIKWGSVKDSMHNHSLYFFLYKMPKVLGLGLAFRPTGSTTAAIIAVLHTVLTELSTNLFVQVFALDFSKAFDTVWHVTLMDKMAELQSKYCKQIYCKNILQYIAKI